MDFGMSEIISMHIQIDDINVYPTLGMPSVRTSIEIDKSV